MTSSRGDDPALPADRVREIFHHMNAYQPHGAPSKARGLRLKRPPLIGIPQDPEARRAFDEALRRLNEGGADEPAID